MFWLFGAVVIYMLSWKSKQRGNINYACLGKQRRYINLELYCFYQKKRFEHLTNSCLTFNIIDDNSNY